MICLIFIIERRLYIMNCPKCQALVPAGAAVCPTCGEKMPAPQPAKKKLPIPLIAGGAAALIVIIALICILPGAGAKAVLSRQFKAYDKEDGKYIYENVPQIYLDYRNENLPKDDKMDEDDFIKEFDKKVDSVVDEREKDYKEKYKIMKVRKVKKDVVEQFNEYLDKDSIFNEIYKEDEHKITAAYIIEYRYEVTEDGEYYYGYGEIVAVKEDGKWKNAAYIDDYFDWENGIDDEEEDD